MGNGVRPTLSTEKLFCPETIYIWCLNIKAIKQKATTLYKEDRVCHFYYAVVLLSLIYALAWT